ncbi:hypothetical protein [Telluribacter sp.]|jgi:hypothetical protein|uniref:hypothetical protein n=1 Tax=Telluribacter sp. TaxID=1978767 RepID=UPI002E1450F8|nr:hypothetical protein [Telluribacter sp.]
MKRRNISRTKLLTANNPLINNALSAVDRHTDATKAYSITSNQINQFLAASSLSHLLDGWGYLSSAFNALLNGDESTAIHLGYYAELRSAMCILSTEGLGVFSRKHLGAFSNSTNGEFPTNYYKGVAPNRSYKKPLSPTHEFVWQAMEAWSNSSNKPGDDILRIFKVRGLNFYELIEYFHPLTAGSSLLTLQTVKDWLKEWCFDIKRYRSDRDARNEASYRPQRIKNFEAITDFKQIINELSAFWDVISPTQQSKFDLLDKYLLCKLFNSLYVKIAPAESLDELIRNAFTQHGITDQPLFDFLSHSAPHQNEHVIFTHAATQNISALAVIARATLLLRISIGMVSHLYHAGGMEKSELDFVWNKYGLENGFWSATMPVNDYNDLWLTVESMFEDLKADVNHGGLPNDIYSIRDRNPAEMIYFSQINRAGLWGLDF